MPLLLVSPRNSGSRNSKKRETLVTTRASFPDGKRSENCHRRVIPSCAICNLLQARLYVRILFISDLIVKVNQL